MRYSTEPRFRKYVKGDGLFSFARTFGNIYGKRWTQEWIMQKQHQK